MAAKKKAKATKKEIRPYRGAKTSDLFDELIWRIAIKRSDAEHERDDADAQMEELDELKDQL